MNTTPNRLSALCSEGTVGNKRAAAIADTSGFCRLLILLLIMLCPCYAYSVPAIREDVKRSSRPLCAISSRVLVSESVVITVTPAAAGKKLDFPEVNVDALSKEDLVLELKRVSAIYSCNLSLPPACMLGSPAKPGQLSALVLPIGDFILPLASAFSLTGVCSMQHCLSAAFGP